MSVMQIANNGKGTTHI